MYGSGVPYCDRQTRRKVERHMKKHNLTFAQAYNKIYKTKCSESYDGLDATTTFDNNKSDDDTTTF